MFGTGELVSNNLFWSLKYFEYLSHIPLLYIKGMKNRIKCIPISDEFGPPGAPEDSTSYSGVKNDFDALVLSHETLQTGRKLNEFRVNELGLKPLKLLCTQRTEPYGMSSTAMRRMRVLSTLSGPP